MGKERRDFSSRREYIKKLGAVGGVTATFGPGSAQAVGSTDRNDEIRYVAGWVHTNREAIRNGAAPEKKPIYDTAPAEEYKRTKAAHRKALQMQASLDAKYGEQPIKVGVTTDGGRKKIIVDRIVHEIPVFVGEEDSSSGGRVEYRYNRPGVERNELLAELPETATQTVSIDGSRSTYRMDVEVNERTRTYTAEYNSTYRPVPGGCQIEIKAEPATAPAGTTACPVYNSDKSDWQILTAGHLFTENSGSDDVMQPVDGAWDDKQIGTGDIERFNETSGGDITFDAGTVSINTDWTKKLADDNGSYAEYIAYGNVSWDTIEQNEGDSSYTVYQQGRTTGRGSGYIEAAYPGDKEFKTSINTQGGDSGGPFFVDYDGGDILMMGVQSWGSNEQNGEYQSSGGFSIERIEDELPVGI